MWLIFLTIIIGILKFGIPLLIPLLIRYTIDDIIMPEGLGTDERMTMLIQILLVFAFIFIIKSMKRYSIISKSWFSQRLFSEM